MSILLKPWPIETLTSRLLEGDFLYQLTQERRKMRGFDVRENKLEDILCAVLTRQFGKDRVALRKQIGTVLSLRDRPFPARTMPDLTFEHRDRIHISEVKSSRIDYARFDNVFDSRPFRNYLHSVGDAGKTPWEVEQDLIKLGCFKDLSPRVGSCLFIMVDAYDGPGRSWTDVFSSKREFLNTMRTDLVKGLTDTLLAATLIEPLTTDRASARLITCAVHSWTP